MSPSEPTRFGYARVSTTDQDLTLQREALKGRLHPHPGGVSRTTAENARRQGPHDARVWPVFVR